MPYKELFSTAATLLTFIAFFPYIRSTIKGLSKPHMFSWIIWGSAGLIVFLAQLKDGGGLGAWPTGVSSLLSFSIAILAYWKRTDLHITPSDWLFFITAMSSLPLWYLSSDPLWAVVVVTVVDLLGFGPSLRKAYARPNEDSIMVFAILSARNVLSIMALENYSLTTVLFPTAVTVPCLLLATVMVYRRRQLEYIRC